MKKHLFNDIEPAIFSVENQLREQLLDFGNNEIKNSELRQVFCSYILRLNLSYKNEEIVELINNIFLQHQVKPIKNFGLNCICVRIARLFLSKIESRPDIAQLIVEKKINTVRDSIVHNIPSINKGWPDSVLDIKLSRERIKYISIYKEFRAWYLGE